MGKLTPLAVADPRHAGVVVARSGSLSPAGQGGTGQGRAGHCQGWTGWRGQKQRLS